MKPCSLIFTISLVFCFAFSTINRSPRDEDTVPPDLGKEPTTILILETPRKMVNKSFEETFEKHYKGEIMVIPTESLYSKLYKDPKKYRYYMETEINFRSASGMGNTRMPATYLYSYRIIDRENNKAYGTSNASDAWHSLLKRYVRKLEEVRKENSKE